jgi:addiction module RelB/DinJ family antitoxin
VFLIPANALVRTRIDPVVKERAAVVLEEQGLTVSDAVRILLTRTANEGVLPFTQANNAAAHDMWFRAWTILDLLFRMKRWRRTSPDAALPRAARCNSQCNWKGSSFDDRKGTFSDNR